MPNGDSAATAIYWDSCCFLSLIEADPTRVPVLNAVAEEAERGSIRLYTSVLSIVEVAFAAAERDRRALDPQIAEVIDRLWHPSSPFQLVEIFPALVVRAKDLMRGAIPSGGAIPKPADAIHLATAERVGASELHTYDHKLRNAGRNLPFTLSVREPVAETIVWQDDE